MPTKKPNRNGRRTKDAIALLEEDHGTVRALLSKLEKTTPRGEKKREELRAKIADEFRIHARIEEKIFYPAYHEAARSAEDVKLFFEAAEEHAIAEHALRALEHSEPASDVFGARAKVLKDLIEHHAEEEEEEMFPRARKLLGAETLAELGAEMAALKRTLADGESGVLAPLRRVARSVERGLSPAGIAGGRSRKGPR